MTAASLSHRPVRDKLVNFGALTALLVLGGLALFGPSGVLAWGDDSARLSQHRQQIAALCSIRRMSIRILRQSWCGAT